MCDEHAQKCFIGLARETGSIGDRTPDVSRGARCHSSTPIISYLGKMRQLTDRRRLPTIPEDGLCSIASKYHTSSTVTPVQRCTPESQRVQRVATPCSAAA